MHHIYLKNESYTIYKSDYKEDFDHLVRSLRIKPGEKIKVDVIDSDISYIAIVKNIDNDSIEIEKIEDIKILKNNIKINLYQGIPKSDKLEMVIEKAVELGVNSIHPINMVNCIKKIDKNDNKKIDRYNKISKEASIQSMRHDIPKVYEVVDFKNMLEDIKNNKYNILFYENEKDENKLKDVLESIRSEKDDIDINIIIGPEGGYDINEIEMAKSYDIGIYTLGENILRTETAAIASVCLFRYII